MITEIERTPTHVIQKISTYGRKDVKKAGNTSAIVVHGYQIIPHGKVGDSSAIVRFDTLAEARIHAGSKAALQPKPKKRK